MNELVPLSYARSAWNTLHNTELAGHDDHLTAEQAAQINNHYDIEVHMGAHGLPLPPESTDPFDILNLPTQGEYQAAANVVNSMQPGDVLFTEGYGFTRQRPEPVPDIFSQLSDVEAPATPMARLSRQLVLMSQPLIVGMKQEMYTRLEQSRQNYEISVWEYARQLAELKGIRVVLTDHDAFEIESMQAISGGKSVPELLTSPHQEDRDLADRWKRSREYKARNTLKDYALKHLPPADAPIPERKPRLVQLFGAGHKEDLEKAYNDIGLDVNIVTMRVNSVHERVAEQALRATSGAILELLAQTTSDSTAVINHEEK